MNYVTVLILAVVNIVILTVGAALFQLFEDENAREHLQEIVDHKEEFLSKLFCCHVMSTYRQ